MLHVMYLCGRSVNFTNLRVSIGKRPLHSGVTSLVGVDQRCTRWTISYLLSLGSPLFIHGVVSPGPRGLVRYPRHEFNGTEALSQ